MAVTDPRPLPARRKWSAVAVATVIELVSFWAIVVAVARGLSEEAAGPAAGPFALGFALVPFAFLVLAFGTNNPRAPGATLRAMAYWFLIGFPLILLVEPAPGLAAGYGLGAIPAMRMDAGHSWKARLGWVAGLVVYVFVLITWLAPGPGALTASLLPFATVAFADWVMEQKREAEDR